AQMERIDAAIAAWTSQRSPEEVMRAMHAAEVPTGSIYSIADIVRDPHYAARGMLETVVDADGEAVKVPGVVPKLSATPGAIRERAPRLGEHTDALLREVGYDAAAIAALRSKGAI